jgi:Phosphotransferase System HPr (HPr) Family
MIKEKKISKPNGLKAEDCAVIAQAAGRYRADVFIIKGNKKVNAKSVMGLISLNMKKDETVYLAVSGEEEKIAEDHLIKLL